MSRSSNSPTKRKALRDIEIPPEYEDGYNLLSIRQYRNLFQYILSDAVCPLTKEVRTLITPKPYITAEFSKALNNFLSIYQSDKRTLSKYPAFSIIYASTFTLLLGTTGKDEVNSLFKFMAAFTPTVTNFLEESLLDVLIPFTIVKTILDDPPVRTDFIFALCEAYSISVFIPHFLKCIKMIMNDKKVNRYHVNLFIKIVQTYNLEPTEVDAVKKIVDVLLKETHPLTKDSIKILKQTLDDMEMDNEQMMQPNSPPQDRFSPSQKGLNSPRSVASSRHSYISGASSFAAPSTRSISPEILEEFLDNIEAENYVSPATILNDIRQQLERLKDFPRNRSFEPLFELAMKTYKSKEITKDEQKQIYLLMTSVNTLCSPKKLLKLYLKSQPNKGFQSDFLEQCYQHFLKTSHVQDRISPNIRLPVSLVIQSDLEPRKDIEFAFTCLNYWESSYDGVRRVWELIKTEPSIDINEYFDPLDFTQKCFLITGLRAHMQDDNLESLESRIEELDHRMMSETKSARVAREAQQVGEKMSELIKSETPKVKKSGSPFMSGSASASASVSASASARGTPSKYNSRYGEPTNVPTNATTMSGSRGKLSDSPRFATDSANGTQYNVSRYGGESATPTLSSTKKNSLLHRNETQTINFPSSERGGINSGKYGTTKKYYYSSEENNEALQQQQLQQQLQQPYMQSTPNAYAKNSSKSPKIPPATSKNAYGSATKTGPAPKSAKLAQKSNHSVRPNIYGAINK